MPTSASIDIAFLINMLTFVHLLTCTIYPFAYSSFVFLFHLFHFICSLYCVPHVCLYGRLKPLRCIFIVAALWSSFSFAFRYATVKTTAFCTCLSMCTSYSFHASRRGSLYLSCAVVRELVFSPLAFILRRGEVSRSRYSQRDSIQCVPRSLSLPGLCNSA